MTLSMQARFAGCLLGVGVGDAAGAPFEGLTSELIYAQFGRPSEIIAHHPVETLYFTDDTHMTMAVAEVLCAEGGIRDEALMRAFAAGYNDKRGYGTGTRRLLEAVIRGDDWRQVLATQFAGGSYGNGGAMRVAPVGLFFHRDLDRVWEEAGKSAACTHRHPLGVEGAQLQALAVALAVRGEAGNRDGFFGELYHRATLEEYQWLLRTAWKFQPTDSLAMLGSSLEAHRSVVTAIACFAVSPDSYAGAISRALVLGDDVDTVMGMAGAISGAHLGVGAIPVELIGRLEKEGRGRAYLEDLAGRLYARFEEM